MTVGYAVVAFAACAGVVAFVVGSHPTVAEGVRKAHVRRNPRVFPKQADALADGGDDLPDGLTRVECVACGKGVITNDAEVDRCVGCREE